MSALADKIEALDGRNVKGDMTILTAEIAKSLGWVRVTPSEARSKKGHWIAPEDCRDGKPVYCSLHGTTLHALPPNWLWSLDAAMTLADGMTEAQIWNIWNEALRNCSKAEKDLRKDLPRYFCAAALRAREASQ